MTNQRLLTVRQAALSLGHTQKYIRDLLYEDKLPGAKKVGRQWFIPAGAVETRLKARRSQQEQAT